MIKMIQLQEKNIGDNSIQIVLIKELATKVNNKNKNIKNNIDKSQKLKINKEQQQNNK